MRRISTRVAPAPKLATTRLFLRARLTSWSPDGFSSSAERSTGEEIT
jgi:hypothetical protein